MPAPEGEEFSIVMEMERKVFGAMTGAPKEDKPRGPVTPGSGIGK